MSSWAQQLEAIRRADQRLPSRTTASARLLSRPNGELTRAGQFYYGFVGGPLEAVRRGAAPHPRGAHGLHPPLLGAQEARALPAARRQLPSPRPTRSSCAPRGSATPSPTPAARGSRCGARCTCATPPARTSLRPYPPSPNGMGRLRSLATLTPLEGGLWGTDCPFLLQERGRRPEIQHTETSSALVARDALT